jgi:phage shock protein E
MVKQAGKWMKKSAFWALLVILLAGCTSQPAAGASVDISIEEAQQLWQNNEAILIDVRTPAEYRDGHIPGVANIPLDQIDQRSGEVPTDKKVVLICRSGNRSAQATRILRGKGFINVYNSTSGMSSWKGPIE